MAARLVSLTMSDRSHCDRGVGDVLDYLVDHNDSDSSGLHDGNDNHSDDYHHSYGICPLLTLQCEKKISIVVYLDLISGTVFPFSRLCSSCLN